MGYGFAHFSSPARGFPDGFAPQADMLSKGVDCPFWRRIELEVSADVARYALRHYAENPKYALTASLITALAVVFCCSAYSSRGRASRSGSNALTASASGSVSGWTGPRDHAKEFLITTYASTLFRIALRRAAR